MIKSTFELENKLALAGYNFVIGIDEAGRGPLAGPVVASAVTLKNKKSQVTAHELCDLVRDSKTLSEKQREKMFDFVEDNFYVGVGIIDQKIIDRINILEASFLAMKAAITDLKKNLKGFDPLRGVEPLQSVILVDGNKKIPNLSIEQKAIVNGDKFVKSISAASIIAKVTRDRIMMDMHAKFPEYAFDKHKGYGTKLHFEMLENFGPCAIHRKSFEPVRSLVKKRK